LKNSHTNTGTVFLIPAEESRSDYIRRSLERALDFSEAHEVPMLQDPELQRALAR